MCGEKQHSEQKVGTMQGSPPRMRGKVAPHLLSSCISGITPAHAGKSSLIVVSRLKSRDHPRACGEKHKKKPLQQRKKGSPPRMRGKAQKETAAATEEGITPAHAGKRKRKRGRKNRYGDHPRACGEKHSVVSFINFVLGSPPRMRGKARCQVRRDQWRGITPAHAGKSRVQGLLPAEGRDHPRACGEKYTTQKKRRDRQGSPPRMRGKVSAFLAGITTEGITPAHAGKSSMLVVCLKSQRDHPRACGEKPTCPGPASGSPGSPPRMRGKVPLKAEGYDADRITPAHAGKSVILPFVDRFPTDHPRACGEKTKKIP